MYAYPALFLTLEALKITSIWSDFPLTRKSLKNPTLKTNYQSGQLFQHPSTSEFIFKRFTGITAVFLLLLSFLIPSDEKAKAEALGFWHRCETLFRSPPGCETGHLVRHFNIRHVCFWAPRVLNPTRHWYSLLKANSSRNHSGPPRDDWAQRGGGGGPFIRVSESHPRTAFCRARGHYGPDLFGEAAVSASARTRTHAASEIEAVRRINFPSDASISHRVLACQSKCCRRQSDIRSGFLPFSITGCAPPRSSPLPSCHQAAIIAF